MKIYGELHRYVSLRIYKRQSLFSGDLVWVSLAIYVTMSKSVKHVHYYNNFGEAFSRWNVQEYEEVQTTKCWTTEDNIWVGGGQDYCIFVLKQKVT